jgi:Fe-S cluster biogenesis protein NfuA
MDGKTLKSIEDKITETIDKYITPSISLHGGKIELLSYDKEDKHVHVKLSGSCFPKDIKSISHEEAEITNPYYT